MPVPGDPLGGQRFGLIDNFNDTDLPKEYIRIIKQALIKYMQSIRNKYNDFTSQLANFKAKVMEGDPDGKKSKKLSSMEKDLFEKMYSL
jgi:hypothetical protein